MKLKNFVATFFLIISGPVNPCDNTVCNNGRCVVHNGNAECVCNNGYELQNNACVSGEIRNFRPQADISNFEKTKVL